MSLCYNQVMITTRLLAGLVQIITTIVEMLLMLRIVLKLFGANTAAPFVDWVYQTTQPLLTPFEGMFPSPSLTGGFIIEFSTLFALLTYAFISYLLLYALGLIETSVENKDSRK